MTKWHLSVHSKRERSFWILNIFVIASEHSRMNYSLSLSFSHSLKARYSCGFSFRLRFASELHEIEKIFNAAALRSFVGPDKFAAATIILKN